MRIPAISLATVILLGGCSMGIQPGGKSPSVTYTVPRTYQIVYLRAQNQADECLRGASQFSVRAQVDPAMQSGVVSVVRPLGQAEMARTELKAIDAQHTEVTQTVWGKYPWDINALHAMRESIRMDMSICFAYK